MSEFESGMAHASQSSTTSAKAGGFSHMGQCPVPSMTTIAVLVLGVLWQWFAQTAAYKAAVCVYGSAHLSGEWPLDGDPSATQTVSWPDATFALYIDFWPVWAALALGALAAVIRYGARLQRDTRGLV
ncbi:hypothetical protein [Microbacterium sp. PAMC21962]|uniref:hypothetical protein n=1 Tax=Microbacterium sp. PAMC21962 TaxID=2861280 RepID=UPI001C632359|nr:hypothetical protein [Microbacterium sp. PAMC21962]QYF97104.1 hypothetical protein KY498_13200 [Microbacterium sp. PAMC21962]